jgi:hypothetical protein
LKKRVLFGLRLFLFSFHYTRRFFRQVDFFADFAQNKEDTRRNLSSSYYISDFWFPVCSIK